MNEVVEAREDAKVVDVTASSVTAEVIYFVSLWNITMMEPPDGTVEHLKSPCPPLSEVTIIVRFMRYTYLTSFRCCFKPERLLCHRFS
jgi:hypothetical protein